MNDSGREIGDGPGAARMLGRGLVRRCPWCGERRLFASWLELLPSCPRCGLKMDRGQGDFFLGAYTLNLVTAELLMVAVLGLFVMMTWPAVPWDFILYGGAALMVLAPIVFFPISRTLWLAIDLVFQPPEAVDFDQDHLQPPAPNL